MSYKTLKKWLVRERKQKKMGCLLPRATEAKMAEMEEVEVAPCVLVPCNTCTRTFRPEALAKHAKVCEKTLMKKRKKFDSAKQRIQGTDLAQFLPSVKQPKNKVPSPKKEPQSRWKEKHEELVRTLRAAKGGCSGGGGDAAGPKPAGHDQCPYCDRYFGPKAFDRHVHWCKEQRLKVQPKTEDVVKAAERLHARTKYRAPVMRSQRLLTKEKYSPGNRSTPANIPVLPPNTLSHRHTPGLRFKGRIKGVQNEGGRVETSNDRSVISHRSISIERKATPQRSESVERRVTAQYGDSLERRLPGQRCELVEQRGATAVRNECVERSKPGRLSSETRPTGTGSPVASAPDPSLRRRRYSPSSLTTRTVPVSPQNSECRNSESGHSETDGSESSETRLPKLKLGAIPMANRDLDIYDPFVSAELQMLELLQGEREKVEAVHVVSAEQVGLKEAVESITNQNPATQTNQPPDNETKDTVCEAIPATLANNNNYSNTGLDKSLYGTVSPSTNIKLRKGSLDSGLCGKIVSTNVNLKADDIRLYGKTVSIDDNFKADNDGIYGKINNNWKGNEVGNGKAMNNEATSLDRLYGSISNSNKNGNSDEQDELASPTESVGSENSGDSTCTVQEKGRKVSDDNICDVLNINDGLPARVMSLSTLSLCSEMSLDGETGWTGRGVVGPRRKLDMAALLYGGEEHARDHELAHVHRQLIDSMIEFDKLLNDPSPPSTANTDSAYNSLNRRTPVASSGISDEPSRFCHECGGRYPLPTAKFCCLCGVRRIAI